MQTDALGRLHVHGLREEAAAFASGVAAALTAGEAAEPSRTDYCWHGEERREREI